MEYQVGAIYKSSITENIFIYSGKEQGNYSKQVNVFIAVPSGYKSYKKSKSLIKVAEPCETKKLYPEYFI